ncbi:hypothetical protein [Rhizobium tubonense]|uniref:Class I SAM-dependent methyltransferase n=1 Tax=Rhizobium tubonense TaxID=484088 RepID=A0A2W4CN84_9HYPH|nr:hypothetical protein [Rhizobium tubonense]PZM11895.1 hypothetical protein CPY51_17420 [Rhizobium tubonense]
MITEAIQYLATLPVTGKAFRPHVRSSVNLWSRAGRCREAWADHEIRSRQAMLDAMSDLRQRRTAVVLGSGLLRDVPIDVLAKAFDTVVLVDLVHLASVRVWLKAKRHHNVRLIERDLSGYEELGPGLAPEPLGFLRQVPYLDFVISANLLSQIGRGVSRRLEGESAGRMPEDAGTRLIDAHLEGLRALPCRTCLVTDISYAVIDRTGKTHEEADLLLGAVPPLSRTSWAWPVAPFGEESKDYQIVHQVIAA